MDQQYQEEQFAQQQEFQQVPIQYEQQQQQQQLPLQPLQQESHDDLNKPTQQLTTLAQNTHEIDGMIETNREIYHAFVILAQNKMRIFQDPSASEESKRNVDLSLNTKACELDRIRKQIVNLQWSIFESLSRIQNKILAEHLPRWHHEQQLSAGGTHRVQASGQLESASLDLIQSWVEKIFEILRALRNQIKGLQLTLMHKPNVKFDSDYLERFVAQLNIALGNLILNTFVIEEQPPQVMKTLSNFKTSVRFLCGNALSGQMINPTVQALIMSEQDARDVIKRHKELIEASWSSYQSPVQEHPDASQPYGGITEIGYNMGALAGSKEFDRSQIVNNNNMLEFDSTRGQMISNFKNMQVKKIKRPEKKMTDSVMEDKFILLFFTQIRMADDSAAFASRYRRGDLLFHVLAFSLPVVVIVNVRQEPLALATITWHNAFATQDDLLYRVPDSVPWRDLGGALSDKFLSQTGRCLSHSDLRHLAGKICQTREESLDETLVTWNQFSKKAPSEKFTFWEWFYSVLKLTKDHLKELWSADLVYGFIDKQSCSSMMLDSSPVGTFLIRFSETMLGGVTITWVYDSNKLCLDEHDFQDPSLTNTRTRAVNHLRPFSAKQLVTRSLADSIRDLKDLVYLYPNRGKDEAFGAYYSPIESIEPPEGYVDSLVVTTLARDYPVSQGPAQTVTPASLDSAYHSPPEIIFQDIIMDEGQEYLNL